MDATDPATNRALDYLARALAAAVDDVTIRRTIHAEVAKRFDGDTEALWSSLASGSRFNQRVAAAANLTQGSESTVAGVIANYTRAMPRVQIAVPEVFDSWDPEAYAPLVAFIPEGIDDLALEAVTAYDANGDSVELDPWAVPEEPVIVVGLNERTDEAGRLLTSTSPERNPSRNSTRMRAAAADPDDDNEDAVRRRTPYQVRMYLVNLRTDNEPTIKGDAEISHRALSKGCNGVQYTDYDWTNLNDDGDGWQGPRELGYTRCSVVFSWWEDDGGDFDFELTFRDFGLGIGMDDADDPIGSGALRYVEFAGAGTDDWDKLDWSDLYQYSD